MLRPQDRGQRALAAAGGGGATLCRLGGIGPADGAGPCW